ncbi:hypothetical protein SAMN04489760_12913 [Syntrophus gentianae]|uniref:Uncharacterized protein n=1 Tax=Syntrophus gentianae TaxID=43775 RepID=A0A1H8A3F3_9BACT|nr:hypothetical protein SAMN04489760_12913 [Syntrophus gentianae]
MAASSLSSIAISTARFAVSRSSFACLFVVKASSMFIMLLCVPMIHCQLLGGGAYRQDSFYSTLDRLTYHLFFKVNDVFSFLLLILFSCSVLRQETGEEFILSTLTLSPVSFNLIPLSLPSF